MPSCCDNPPNRPAREVLDRLIDTVAWAKTCMLMTAATKPGSPDRETQLMTLRQALIEPRKIVDEILEQGKALPRDVIVTLRSCELAVPKLEAGAVLRQPAASGA